MNKQRESNIELLKIFAIVMIVLSHAIPTGYDYSYSTNNISQIFLVLFSYAGKFGNDIFIICSAWFLLDNSKVNKKKILYIIGDCFIISFVFLIIFFVLGYDLPLKVIIKQLFPVWMSNNWFISCYLLLYMIHGYLNKIIQDLDKKHLLRMNVILIFLYYILNLLHSGSFFYSDIIGFVCIYFNVAYVKYYLQYLSSNKKLNLLILIVSLLLCIGVVLLTNFIGLHINMLSDNVMKWNVFVNPLIILNSLSLLNLIKSTNMYVRFINYVSSLSLLIYLFHDNRLFMDYVKNDILIWITKLSFIDSVIESVLIFACSLLFFGIIASILYKYTLQNISKKICDIVYNLLSKVYLIAENYLLKL